MVCELLWGSNKNLTDTKCALGIYGTVCYFRCSDRYATIGGIINRSYGWTITFLWSRPPTCILTQSNFIIALHCRCALSDFPLIAINVYTCTMCYSISSNELVLESCMYAESERKIFKTNSCSFIGAYIAVKHNLKTCNWAYSSQLIYGLLISTFGPTYLNWYLESEANVDWSEIDGLHLTLGNVG